MKLTKVNQAILIASGLVSSAVWADGNKTINNAAFLPSITVSASPIHQHEAFEVPSQIDAISGDEKFARESGSLGEMVEAIPGVNNLSTGSQSGKPIIRGMSNDRVKVLSNGGTTDYQAYGTRHLPNVDAYLSESIEVIRGPQSVLYGSDALGGVVNLISPEIPFGKKAQGEISTEYNTNNNEKHFGAKVGGGNHNWGITAGVSIREGDNFETADAEAKAAPTPPMTTLPVFVDEVPFTNFENKSAHIGVGYLNDAMQVILRHTHWQADQNYLGVGTKDTNADNKPDTFVPIATGQNLANHETQLSAEFFSGDWVFKPSWVYTENRREARPGQPFETMQKDAEFLDIEVKRHDWKFAAEHPEVGGFEGEIGVEVSQKEQSLLAGHLTPSADMDKKAVYLFEEADYDQWLLQFGARYDWVDVYAPLDGNNEHFVNKNIFNNSTNDQSFGVWSGSLGANYRLTKQWSIAGNIARGFRAPSIFELYAGGVHGGVQAYQIGNPELEAETALNTDLSLRWQTQTTQMVATVYQNWVDNYIYLASTGNFRNKSGALVANGLEEMKAEQTDATFKGFEFSFNHQWNAQWQTALALEVIESENDKTGQELPLMPADNLRVSVSYLPQDFMSMRKQKLTLEGKFVAQKDSAGTYEPFSQFDSKPFGRASTEAYNLWNLRYQAQLPMDKQNLKVSLAVENVFDKAYVDFLDTYKGYTLAQGRNIKLNVALSF